MMSIQHRESSLVRRTKQSYEIDRDSANIDHHKSTNQHPQEEEEDFSAPT